ncbi:TonB-dependent receptor [Mucilaginibacter limnophilus]|uniref:TonB-dependent receptor n=1 Tax=Mucilaginibacter limnophilus TaxID=1932778 RepID=UPI0013E2D928|nr:TonB-dependent receptor [Mucilaginibacter limnophilus]
MYKLSIAFLTAVLLIGNANAQTNKPVTDTVRRLKEVTIKGYLSEQPLLSSPASVSVIGSSELKLQPDNSFIPALNTVPGIRAEERSPGSYRLSVRGSLLRSPFGVRNIKVYYDEIPLTDAGGNTYLNALDFNSIRSIEILKGPDGSLFGANTGGVVIFNPFSNIDSNSATVGITTGSYGLFHENVTVQNQTGKNQLGVNQAYQSYGGYREHSYMYRHFVNINDKLTYGQNNNELRALAFYSDLNYQTPGGLTLAQMEVNPRAARPATPAIGGAISQQIEIRQKMYFGGLVNEWHINNRFKNVATVFGNHVDFANPFITNYERRDEDTYGLRTYFEYSAVPQANFDWHLNLGVEWQQTNSDISNYDNNSGERGDRQAIDKLNTNQHFIFTRYAATIYKKLQLEAALSVNYFKFRFKNIYPFNEAGFSDKDFDAQLMPRLALSYLITDNFTWRASISRGYSSPTNLEIRPSSNIVNTMLNPQFGWNYETGFRWRTQDGKTWVDVSAFYYKLRNAIVARKQADETEYYVNAGGTTQPGVEVEFNSWLYSNGTGVINGVKFNTAYTFSKFKFDDYADAANNYSGNKLTGTPQRVVVSNVQILFQRNLYLFVQHNFTGAIPLNDANTVYAAKYHLLQARAGWQHTFGKTKLELFAGADNILNQKYSLGNDLNAIGNRYFNPAPLRNYSVGMNLGL